VKRIVHGVLVILLVTFLVVALMSLAPGSVASVILGDGATPDAVARLEHEMGLDQSVFQQWLS
jgi:peptide/nickel transport system permease protein